MIKPWQKDVLPNFEAAAGRYNEVAQLQRAVAWRLAKQCSKQNIPNGFWVDLGSGTGLLADALETCIPKQSVHRIDASSKMLSSQKSTHSWQTWDLNIGLPRWENRPKLIASSFAIHWLKDPEQRIKEWCNALAPGGWLALAVPVKESFCEWRLAATKVNVACTAMPLPTQKSLIKAVDNLEIRYAKLHQFTQHGASPFSLLKPMIQAGAHATPKSNLSYGEWRRLEKAWSSQTRLGKVQLTWLIQLLIVRR